MPDTLDPVVSVIRDLVQDSSRFGAYLHGSHARRDAGSGSDIDVLILCAAGVSSEDRDTLQARCLAEVPADPDDIDLKVVPADVFADDPWVDLHSARWIAGRTWHHELPPRTLDQAARESLLVLRVLIEDEAFARPDSDAVRKAVGRLCSVLAALIDGTAPSSATEAVGILNRYRCDSAAQRLLGIVEQLGAARSGSGPPVPAGEVASCAAIVVERLRAAVHGGKLGPRCTVAADGVLTAWDHVVRTRTVAGSSSTGTPIPPNLRAWVAAQVGGIDQVRDASWPRASSRVWKVSVGERSFFVKLAPTESDQDREVVGSRFAERILDDLQTPRLIASHRRLRATVTTPVPGRIVRGLPLDTSAELQVHTEAGRLLRRWHDQGGEPSEDQRTSARAAMQEKAVEVHQCLQRTFDELRPEQRDLVLAVAHDLPDLASQLPFVFQHGDYATRNWLWDHAHGRLGLIDFATVGWGVAAEEVVWLRAAVWASRPDLETAFYAGYGRPPSAQEEQLTRLLIVRMGVSYLDTGLRSRRDDLVERGRLILDDVLTRVRPAP